MDLIRDSFWSSFGAPKVSRKSSKKAYGILEDPPPNLESFRCTLLRCLLTYLLYARDGFDFFFTIEIILTVKRNKTSVMGQALQVTEAGRELADPAGVAA